MTFNAHGLTGLVSKYAAGCFVILAASSLLLNAEVRADGSQDPSLVAAPVDRVFVPLGFDNNDNVEVVVHGHFPNTCYKVGPTTATVDMEAKTVTIQAQAYSYAGFVCAQVLVPFVSEVKLGLMKEGEYRVTVVGSPDLVIDPLIVGAATTSNPDDYLYAPVEQAAIEQEATGTNYVKIEGTYPYMFIGCMKINEVKVSLSSQVIVVQPIAEILEDRLCNPLESKKFSIKTPVSFPLSFTEYLIHVRTLSGTSVNRFIEIGN
jgi:hypothetical protein